MAKMNKVKLPSGEYVPVNDERIHIYRSLTGTAAETSSPYTHAKWDVADSTITEYVDGMVVCVKVPVAGHGTYGTGLQINSLGYKPIVYNVSSMISTRYSVGSVVWAVYNATQTASLYVNSASASTVTGCWQVMDYDSNTTAIYNLVRYNGSRIVKADLLRYVISFRKNETTIVPIHSNAGTGTSANTAVTTTTKTMTTESFDPFGEIYYYATNTKISAGELVAMSTMSTQRHAIDARYSFNCAKTLTSNKELYLVVDLQSDGMVKLASTPWAQTLPSTNDGHLYILLGYTYSSYQFELYYYHPIYYHDGTQLRQYGGDKTFSGNYNDLTNKPTIPDAVSGVNDGTNWTSITIGETTKAIPSGGGSSTLSALTDTNISNPSDGQIVKYDYSTSKWVNNDINSAIQKLTSPVRIWDLEPGIYILPDNCTIYYFGASNSNISVYAYGGGIIRVWWCYGKQVKMFEVVSNDNFDNNVSNARFYFITGKTNSTTGTAKSYTLLSSDDLTNGTYAYGHTVTTMTDLDSALRNGSYMGDLSSNCANKPLNLTLTENIKYHIFVYNTKSVTTLNSFIGYTIRQDLYLPTLNKHYYRIVQYYNNVVTPNTSIDNADANGWVEVFETFPALTNNAGKVLAVNSNADGVEWVTPSSGGGTTVTLPSGYDASTGITLSSSSLTTVATVGGVDLKLKAPASSGGLSDYDFTHTANTTVSTSTTTITFAANQRGSAMLTISADLGLTIACNNESDNYLWIKNTGSAEVDVTISGVTKNSTTVSNVYVPSDGITVPAGGLCEIGVIVNSDGAFITSRNDLAL